MKGKKYSNVGTMLKRPSAKIFYAVLAAFPILQFCVFYFGVNFNSIFLAFQEYDIETSTYSFAGFSNFVDFIKSLKSSEGLYYGLRNSVIFYLVGLVIGLPCGLLFAYYVYKKMFMYKTMRFFLFMPSIIPIIVITILFSNFISNVFPAIGLPDYLYQTSTQFPTLLIFTTWLGFGGGILIYSGTMSQLSPSLTEAAQIDGASEMRQFISVIMPGIFPTVSTFLISGVGSLFLNGGNVYTFLGDSAPPESYTLGYYLFVQVIGSNSGIELYPYASAGGILMTLVAAPLTFLVKWLLEKFGPSED